MNAKEFLAKIVLGKDVYKDLAIAEKEMNEAKDEYYNACQTISTLEERNRVLSDSFDASKQELSSLKSENDSIDTMLSLLLNDEELCDAKAILEGRLEDKKALLENLIENLRSSQEEHANTQTQLKILQEEQTSLDKDVYNLTHEIEVLKEKSGAGGKPIAKKQIILAQRKDIRDNLLTLKDEWKDTLQNIMKRVSDADSLESLEELKYELGNYESRANNAIEISVK